MLKNKILAGPIIYLSLAHNEKHIEKYLKYLDKILFEMKKNNKNLINLINKDDLDFAEIKRYN